MLKETVEFGLFRIIITLRKLGQKELGLIATEIFQVYETAHVILLSTAVHT